MTVLRTVFVCCSGLWNGAMVFFSLVTLPRLFSSLDKVEAGNVAALLFPAYYGFGLLVGAGALLAALMLGASLASRRWLVISGLLAAMLGAQAWAAFVIDPRMVALRPAARAGEALALGQFGVLHGQAVALNAAVLLLGLSVWIYVVARPND